MGKRVEKWVWGRGAQGNWWGYRRQEREYGEWEEGNDHSLGSHFGEFNSKKPYIIQSIRHMQN